MHLGMQIDTGNDWGHALRDGAVAGTVAGVLSAAVLAGAGRREAGSAVAPINAVSHWLWGDEALQADRASVRHTLVGFLTHHASAVFWATLAAKLWPLPAQGRSVPQALAGGIATAAAAAAIDYTLVPKRFTPGFEHRLSTPAMLATFGALAAGLAIGAVLLREAADH